MMRVRILSAVVLLLIAATLTRAYVEAPHTLGLCVRDSSNIVLVQVERVNKEKGMIIYKKLQDLKGTHPEAQIKHNIGQRGFHPREWQNVMNWAEVGKKAVFFHNGSASETCLGTYWYQCYREGDWWGMSHAEPFLLRTYYGDPEKLADAVTRIVGGKEVVVPCLADGNKNDLHLRKGKVQRLRASLKLLDYNAKRDFVGWGGGDGDDFPEFKTITLLAAGAADWKFLPLRGNPPPGPRWPYADCDDKAWRTGKTPIGYGEAELNNRNGTLIKEQGQPFVFRRVVEVPSDLLAHKGVTFHLSVASDNRADVYVNGVQVYKDPVADHEFSYWNGEVELAAKQLQAGKNLIAVQVDNTQNSSDLYFDLELTAQVPLPPKKAVAGSASDRTVAGSASDRTVAGSASDRTVAGSASDRKGETVRSLALPATAAMPERPGALTVDKARRAVLIECAVAPRKLPTLNEVYPLEVIATFPAPQGQKAHETVVTVTGVRPSSVHKALTELGLQPGRPARGDDARAEGPKVKVYLEFNGKRVPVESLLVDRRNGKPLPPLTWHFTGSTLRQPDPEKDDKVFGADLTGTLIGLFPVTDDTVLQSSLTMKDEGAYKLEIVKDALPKEGTVGKLIIEVAEGR